jgi:hypothetical protein
MKQGYNSRLDESLGARNGKKTQNLKDRRDESKGAKKGAGKRAYSSVSTMDKPKKKRVVQMASTMDGSEIKSVTRRSGKKVVTEKNKETGFKQKQKFRKDGTVKKTVTRTKGGVEKEIERGKKRIDVRKYKDEGVKTRTVTNMKKNDQYKDKKKKSVQKFISDRKNDNLKDFKNMIDNTATQDAKTSIKNSSFARLPIELVKEALKPENNVLPANEMDRMEQKKNQPMINKLNRESEKQRKENQ